MNVTPEQQKIENAFGRLTHALNERGMTEQEEKAWRIVNAALQAKPTLDADALFPMLTQEIEEQIVYSIQMSNTEWQISDGHIKRIMWLTWNTAKAAALERFRSPVAGGEPNQSDRNR